MPAEEKRLWHSHHYEVKSGVLVAPGIPELAERVYFKDLVSTYGKTFHTWQIDRDEFPYGAPQLMMSFTQDGRKRRASNRHVSLRADGVGAGAGSSKLPPPQRVSKPLGLRLTSLGCVWNAGEARRSISVFPHQPRGNSTGSDRLCRVTV